MLCMIISSAGTIGLRYWNRSPEILHSLKNSPTLVQGPPIRWMLTTFCWWRIVDSIWFRRFFISWTRIIQHLCEEVPRQDNFKNRNNGNCKLSTSVRCEHIIDDVPSLSTSCVYFSDWRVSWEDLSDRRNSHLASHIKRSYPTYEIHHGRTNNDDVKLLCSSRSKPQTTRIQLRSRPVSQSCWLRRMATSRPRWIPPDPSIMTCLDTVHRRQHWKGKLEYQNLDWYISKYQMFALGCFFPPWWLSKWAIKWRIYIPCSITYRS
jgi:hypothetical protein